MDEDSVAAAARERGRAIMREVLGEDYVQRREATHSPLNAALRAMSEEFVYGGLWARPVLDRRLRSLVTLAMLCALDRPHELRIHLVAALGNGLTAEEIAEVFTHSVAYLGFPAAIDALRIAEEVIRDHASDSGRPPGADSSG
jgi:4-carboxymuconolactone decarboxylase